MSISPVTGTTSALQSSSLTQQDFMRILLTQLTYQDPMKPMDNQEFMAQMAQFTSLEQTQQLNNKLETLIGNQAALQSVGLIGRTVDVSTEGGTVMTGTVRSLSFAGDNPVITLQSSAGSTLSGIALSQIINVR